MKKASRHLLSLVLAIVLLFSTSVPAFAETASETTVAIWNVSDGTIKITEELKETETIIREYDNGILTTAVHIPKSQARSSTTTLTVKTINPLGNVVNTEHLSVENVHQSGGVSTFASQVSLGTLKYSTSDGQKTIKVKYETNYIGNSTVTLQSGTTKVATLVSILVSVIGMKAAIASPVINWILGIMGIAATTVSFFFPGRVLSCQQTDYIYHLTNGSLSTHTNQFTSHYYYIIDDRSENASYNGTSKTDGWTPTTAKSQTVPFAQTCYTYMFEGSYSVIGWV